MEPAAHDRVLDTGPGVPESQRGSEDRGRAAPPPGPVGRTAVRRPGTLSRRLRTLVSGAVALSMVLTVVHLALVFLHVAPVNPVSQRYERQVNGWIFPLFEQNWRLFAPNPESVTRQVLARTRQATPGGGTDVSRWVDLTAVDNAAVRHNVAPSHTAQNMLRRAWTTYAEVQGSGDRPSTDRALMMQEYLRNIAVRRVTAVRGGEFQAIQLRVVTRPIAAPVSQSGSRPVRPPAETRNLPWWKVVRDAH